MIQIHEALREILATVTPLPPVVTPIEACLGRFLAADLAATADSPAFDHSAMDGYAVRAADTDTAPTKLPLTGESRAGGPAPGVLVPGHAMRIFTGAPMPAGADAVVIQENTEKAEGTVLIRVTAAPGDNIRLRASDLAAGNPMLLTGARIGPAEIALLASQRVAQAPVHRRPVVAVLCTGDELRTVHDAPEPGTIVNSNAYLLAALIEECGATARILPPARDNLDDITARLREALASDLVLTVGGVSVGDYDLVHDAFTALGIERRLWKVAMKPGKPLAFAVAGTTPLLGLPGNPVSAHIAFEMFARPAIRRMLGDPRPFPVPQHLPLASAHARSTGRLELARAAIVRDAHGVLTVRLQSRQGSGSLTSAVGADALVVFPPDQAQFEAGESVLTIPFGHPWRSEVGPVESVVRS